MYLIIFFIKIAIYCLTGGNKMGRKYRNWRDYTFANGIRISVHYDERSVPRTNHFVIKQTELLQNVFFRSGTWMMTGNGVMHNGTTILDQYGLNLDRLQVILVSLLSRAEF